MSIGEWSTAALRQHASGVKSSPTAFDWEVKEELKERDALVEAIKGAENNIINAMNRCCASILTLLVIMIAAYVYANFK
jgi:aminopeptidase-like protein